MTLSPPPTGFNVSIVHRLCSLYKLFHYALKLFPKQERYTLGQKIENTILEALELALQAVYLPKFRKNETIRKASDKIDLLKYLIRLACETKSINVKKYTALEKEAIEIGRMLGGWLRSS